MSRTKGGPGDSRAIKSSGDGSLKGRRSRIRGYDVIRGTSVISMVGFHLCYDLVMLKGVSVEWFKPPLEDVWRASISWTFLLIAGIMCSYSRSNLRRGAKYLAVAAAIFVATSIVSVDTPISFGIIYVMGFSTVVAWLLDRVIPKELEARSMALLAILLLGLFVLSLGIPTGTFGLGVFGGPSVRVPAAPYQSGLLSWLGFPGPGFASGDYYPPLPYTLLFMVGMLTGRIMSATGVPRWIRALRCRPVEWVGRHALEVYVVHQPVLLLFTGLL